MSQYKGHHRRDEMGNVLSRAEETRVHRLKHPGQRKTWDATYRQSEAGEISHKKYNDSDQGRRKLSDGYLKRKYGKGLDEKKAQRERQHGLCGVCAKPLSINLTDCHWDHHHETGALREILHPRCNLAVGFIESELHLPVLVYLKRHNNA